MAYGDKPEYLIKETESRRSKLHGGWGSTSFNQEKTKLQEAANEHKKLSDKMLEEQSDAGLLDKLIFHPRASAEGKRLNNIINIAVFSIGFVIFAIVFILSRLGI